MFCQNLNRLLMLQALNLVRADMDELAELRLIFQESYHMCPCCRRLIC